MSYLRPLSLIAFISLVGCASQKNDLAYEAHHYKAESDL
jgi:hypothetical protein